MPFFPAYENCGAQKVVKLTSLNTHGLNGPNSPIMKMGKNGKIVFRLSGLDTKKYSALR